MLAVDVIETMVRFQAQGDQTSFSCPHTRQVVPFAALRHLEPDLLARVLTPPPGVVAVSDRLTERLLQSVPLEPKEFTARNAGRFPDIIERPTRYVCPILETSYVLSDDGGITVQGDEGSTRYAVHAPHALLAYRSDAGECRQLLGANVIAHLVSTRALDPVEADSFLCPKTRQEISFSDLRLVSVEVLRKLLATPTADDTTASVSPMRVTDL